jgi:hypothetical protein
MQHKPYHRRCFCLASPSARDRRSDPFLLRSLSQNYSALFNLRGAPLVEALERETGISIHDSAAAAVWASLRLAGADPGRVIGWGRLFRLPT